MDLDRLLFTAINSPGLPVPLERLLAVPNESSSYLPWVLGLALVGVSRGGRRARVTALLCLLAIALTDPIGHRVIRDLVGYPRPCSYWLQVVLRADRCPASFSFPSLHTANVAAMTAVVATRHPRLRRWVLALPFLSGLARIRAGVHTPMDVLGGAVLGAVIGAAVARFAMSSAFPARAMALLRRIAAHGWLVLGAAAACTFALGPASYRVRDTPAQERAALRRLTQAEDPAERVEAAVWLRRHKHLLATTGGTDALAQAVADTDPVVRFHAATTLGHSFATDPTAIEALDRALDDPIVGVRQQAAWGLGMAGSAASRSLSHLEQLTQDPSPGCRRAALSALAHVRGDP